MSPSASASATMSPSASASATTTRWKDADRLAQFVANVVGALLVLSALHALLWRAHAQLPRADQWTLHARDVLHAQLAQHLPDCWTHATNSSALAAAMRCVSLFIAVGDANATTGATGAALSDSSVWSTYLSDQAARMVVVAVSALLVLWLAATKSSWIGWYCWLQLVVVVQWLFALYQLARIAISASAYFTTKTLKLAVSSVRTLRVMLFGIKKKHAAALRVLMKRAKTYEEWTSMAAYLDALEDKADWQVTISPEDREFCDFAQLDKNCHALQEAIASRNVEALKYLLTSFVIRNKLGIDAADLHLEAHSGTKRVIERYNAMVMQAMKLVADAPDQVFARHDKTLFFRELKQSFGLTALCLSGGGAIAMYHMGIIKALLEADLLPNVVSGSSGGSIAAAMLACKTNAEMMTDIIQRDISTRFYAHNIRWFPPLLQQIAHCVKTGFLVECSQFERTTQHFFGEPLNSLEKTMHYTFHDAFVKTGRHVSITVSASDITGHKGPKKLLLNHVSTPHVLLWSAVAVSCSLPGIMKGKKLMARDHEGNVVPYDALGKEWMDGSIQHDLPMETMASCFNVTNFIVSQVNPHVVPFVGDDVHTPHFRKSLFHTLESVIAADVRHRLKMLAFLGLFPKIYGHQFSSYFKQNFSGNVTLIPEFIFLEAIGVKAIVNPSREDMDRYILGGERSVWPKLAYIRHLCEIEKCLDHCLSGLVDPNVVRYGNWLHPDAQHKRLNISDAAHL